MGVVKLLRPQAENLSPREHARKNYMASVLKRADNIAKDQDKMVVAEMRHLVYALVHELSEAFLTNNEMAAALENLVVGLDQTRADLEALRRAVK